MIIILVGVKELNSSIELPRLISDTSFGIEPSMPQLLNHLVRSTKFTPAQSEFSMSEITEQMVCCQL